MNIYERALLEVVKDLVLESGGVSQHELDVLVANKMREIYAEMDKFNKQVDE